MAPRLCAMNTKQLLLIGMKAPQNVNMSGYAHSCVVGTLQYLWTSMGDVRIMTDAVAEWLESQLGHRMTQDIGLNEPVYQEPFIFTRKDFKNFVNQRFEDASDTVQLEVTRRHRDLFNSPNVVPDPALPRQTVGLPIHSQRPALNMQSLNVSEPGGLLDPSLRQPGGMAQFDLSRITLNPQPQPGSSLPTPETFDTFDSVAAILQAARQADKSPVNQTTPWKPSRPSFGARSETGTAVWVLLYELIQNRCIRPSSVFMQYDKQTRQNATAILLELYGISPGVRSSAQVAGSSTQHARLDNLIIQAPPTNITPKSKEPIQRSSRLATLIAVALDQPSTGQGDGLALASQSASGAHQPTTIEGKSRAQGVPTSSNKPKIKLKFGKWKQDTDTYLNQPTQLPQQRNTPHGSSREHDPIREPQRRKPSKPRKWQRG